MEMNAGAGVRGLSLILLIFWTATGLAEDYWLHVDSERSVLAVYTDEGLVRIFDGVAFGQAGVADDRLRGDRTTPRGIFHVTRIDPESRFRLFFGLDYPTHAHARRAYREGLIDRNTYFRIVRARALGIVPPQDTILGGYIGIHGLGAGDPGIHEQFNWTQGCVALTNHQIDELKPYVRLGTRVVIQ
jgi:murein L,D-transpeptidase YafK